ncbi:MAG: adenosylcobinamide-GDP ribazoletransferase [Chloroflexota bacterium]
MATPAPRRLTETPGGLTRALATVRAAFALLTRLPLSSSDEASSGAAAFPLVGVVVGLVGAVPLVVAGSAQPVLGGILAIGAMAVVTGVLHLDGLADTADALVAPYPAAADRARKDPAVGPGGVVALLLVLGTEIAALAGLASGGSGWPAGASLIVAACVARTIPVVAVQTVPGRIPRDGFAGWFAQRVRTFEGVVAVSLATAVTLAVAAAAGSTAIAFGGAIGAVLGLAAAALIVTLRGQLDGDGLGAVVELTVAAVLTATLLLS